MRRLRPSSPTATLDPRPVLRPGRRRRPSPKASGLVRSTLAGLRQPTKPPKSSSQLRPFWPLGDRLVVAPLAVQAGQTFRPSKPSPRLAARVDGAPAPLLHLDGRHVRPPVGLAVVPKRSAESRRRHKIAYAPFVSQIAGQKRPQSATRLRRPLTPVKANRDDLLLRQIVFPRLEALWTTMRFQRLVPRERPAGRPRATVIFSGLGQPNTLQLGELIRPSLRRRSALALSPDRLGRPQFALRPKRDRV